MSPFVEFMNNVVSVIKPDGTRLESIKASVQKNKIFIDGNKIIIKSGDSIEHKMSNGVTDIYEVLDPGFNEEFMGIPAGYQMDVRKLGIPERNKFYQSNVYNMSGNARINNHSVDNSINTHNETSEILELLNGINLILDKSSLSKEEKETGKEIVTAIHDQIASEKPSRKVVEVLAKSLPPLANIATIAQAIIAYMK